MLGRQSTEDRYIVVAIGVVAVLEMAFCSWNLAGNVPLVIDGDCCSYSSSCRRSRCRNGLTVDVVYVAIAKGLSGTRLIAISIKSR